MCPIKTPGLGIVVGTPATGLAGSNAGLTIVPPGFQGFEHTSEISSSVKCIKSVMDCRPC